jgi:phosphoribosyl-AMP cyclohydrolase
MSFDPNTLTYDAAGLIPCIAQDEGTGEVLMFAWMNAESVARTLATGRVTYWSRSRQAFWVKGETSGHLQSLVELRVDCDRDCLLAVVRQEGPACHTGRRSCFYTAVRGGDEVEIILPEGGEG